MLRDGPWQTETGHRGRTQSALSSPRCRARAPVCRARADGRSRAAGERFRREVRRAETDGLKLTIDAGIGIVGRPAGRILKQPDRANSAVTAQIEPVVGAFRDPDEIARLDLDSE